MTFSCSSRMYVSSLVMLPDIAQPIKAADINYKKKKKAFDGIYLIRSGQNGQLINLFLFIFQMGCQKLCECCELLFEVSVFGLGSSSSDHNLVEIESTLPLLTVARNYTSFTHQVPTNI